MVGLGFGVWGLGFGVVLCKVTFGKVTLGGKYRMESSGYCLSLIFFMCGLFGPGRGGEAEDPQGSPQPPSALKWRLAEAMEAADPAAAAAGGGVADEPSWESSRMASSGVPGEPALLASFRPRRRRRVSHRPPHLQEQVDLVVPRGLGRALWRSHNHRTSNLPVSLRPRRVSCRAGERAFFGRRSVTTLWIVCRVGVGVGLGQQIGERE